jgi:hypothetical protein
MFDCEIYCGQTFIFLITVDIWNLILAAGFNIGWLCPKLEIDQKLEQIGCGRELFNVISNKRTCVPNWKNDNCENSFMMLANK